MNKHFYLTLAALALAGTPALHAQTEDNGKKVTITGSIQSDVLIPQEDIKDEQGNVISDDPVMTNTYAELHLLNKYVTAGARLEFTEYPLPGFEKDFKGWGVPYFYVTGKYKWAELTAGDFYEQFGSGLILRTYEERSLGVDNSIRGGRLVLKPWKGINLKLLGGQQRRYWEHNDGAVYGGDLELNIDRWSKRMADKGYYLTLGLSAVSKHQGNPDVPVMTVKPTGETDDAGNPEQGMYSLNVPNNVAAFDARAHLQKGNYSFLVEYAWKGQDPAADNAYTFHKGSALLLSGSYSKRGMSILLQAKRSQNMAYRSDRSVTGSSSFINHLPAFSQQQTYTLAALYPYATQYGRFSDNAALQVPGEWAFQAELGYNFKRKTALGGRYGTNVKVNFSHIRSIDFQPVTDGAVMGTDGYRAPSMRFDEGAKGFFGMGSDIYYQDFNVQVEKKLTKSFKLNLMYMNQRYNKKAIENEGGNIYNNILVLDTKWKINRKFVLRGEVQYMFSHQDKDEREFMAEHPERDQKDWFYGLVEFSWTPYLMFSASDMINVGGTGNNYYMFGLTGTYRNNRLMLSYGRTREGFDCSGGMCRYVPATKGFKISYSYNF